MESDETLKLHFCYFDYNEFYSSQPLVLIDRDESALIKQMEEDLEDLSTKERDEAVKKKIKELRKKLIIMRVKRIRDGGDVSDCGTLFSFASNTSYFQAKTKLTFPTPAGDEICFLHDVPTGSPAGLERIYEMLRSEIFQKEQFRQANMEYKKRIAEIEESGTSSKMSGELTKAVLDMLKGTVAFFKKNATLIKKKGDIKGAKDLFLDIAKIQKELS